MALSSTLISRLTKEHPTVNQLDQILNGIVAYVEVRAEDEDRSDAISHFLHLLGANISKYFNRKVTHVVFKNGKQSTYKKAQLWGVHLVSVSWIERCKEANSIVSETDYPAIIPEEFTSPFFCGKVKKFKSMVPKITDVDITKSLKRRLRRREQQRIKRECREFLKMTPTLQAQLKPPLKRFKSEDAENETSINETSVNVTRHFSLDLSAELTDENIGLEENSWNIPLAERLLNRSLSESINATPQLKPITGKRKLYKCSRKRMLSFSPDVSHSNNSTKCDSSKTTATTMVDSPANFDQTNSSLTEFQLTANKENEVKVHKVLTDFDDDTPTSDDFIKKNGGNTTVMNNSRHVSSPMQFSKTSSIVFTSVIKEEMDTLTAVVGGLGGFNICLSVNETTTHVVCGNPRRTLNVLFGLARGCWVVNQDWVYKSLEKGHWLPETEFMLSTQFPGCGNFRLERRKSSAFRLSIFREFGSMFIGDEITIPKKKLQELITLCGGRVVNQHKIAVIFIGSNKISNKRSTSLTEKWILDSITHNKLQPMDNYKFHS